MLSDHRTPGPRDRTVELDGRSVHLSERGEGSVVVLLHGGQLGTTNYAASADVWTPLVEALSRHHRVVAVDRPGFGRSTVTSPEDVGYAGQEDLVVSALREIGVTDFHVVGHGEGGLLALHIARREDVHIRSCSVIAGNEAAPTGDAPLDVRLLHPPEPYESVQAQAWFVDRVSYTPHHIDDAFLADLVTHAGRESVAHGRSLVTDADIRSELLISKDRLFAYGRDDSYGTPITLVWGSHDPLSSVERGVELMNLLATTHAELSFHLVNRCGHFVFREHPAQTAELLLPFLSRAEEVR
jgi:pimeloyl-ACP methyl ester carboxylesterase